jgi:hypothetical protein
MPCISLRISRSQFQSTRMYYVAHIHADTFQNFSPLPLVCILPLHVLSVLSFRSGLLAIKCFELHKENKQVVRHMGERATSQQCPSKAKMSFKSVKNIGIYKHIHTRAHTKKHTVPVQLLLRNPIQDTLEVTLPDYD